MSKFAAPMVVRIPVGFGKKTGDPWHSVSGEAVFAHTIGWRIAYPSNTEDAVGLLRTALRGNDPTFFFEHRALLDTKEARTLYPGDEFMLPFGKARLVQEGNALTIVTWGAMVLIVGLPLWKAYKNGLFSGDNSLPMFFAVIASLALGALVVSVAFAVVSTLAKDFVMPVLALDDFSLGDAWSAVWRVAASEPGAWAAYMGMKVLCAVGSSIALSIAFVVAMLPAAILIGIPVGILVALGVLAFKTIGAAVGIIICGLAVLLAIGGFFCLLLILTAPVSVFFTSYALYFFGGRYPKLAALLWPQPIPTTPQPQTMGVQPVL